jgi:hypothetical protein
MKDGLSGKMATTSQECKKGIEKAIGILFLSRTMSHTAHLKTTSYAAHKALNEFYDGVVDLADTLAETAQGLYGILDVPFVNASGNINEPISLLQGHLKQLEACMASCDEDYLMNIFQEIQSLYRSTLYKLTYLS